MRITRQLLLSLLCSALTFLAQATELRPNVLDKSYEHDKFGTMPRDIIFEFRAYISSFDSDDDDDGDGKPDIRAIPEWVSYEMRKYPRKLRTGPKRPDPWITDFALFKKGVAPADASYQYTKAFRDRHSNWYDRGHLCMKQHAWRLGADADWNTHTVLNAVPQRARFNSGIWQDLENKTAQWADKYEKVWIVAGPVFTGRKPSKTIGQGQEIKVAIPDALFKIVIKESGQPPRRDVLAFIYAQECEDCLVQRGPYNHARYLVSLQKIEEQTGLRFLTTLSANDQGTLKKQVATRIWD